MSSYRPLRDGWTVTRADPPDSPALPAVVPGCVHTDLLAAGIIPDPYLDANEDTLGWIGRTDWIYRTGFDWAPGGAERTDLVCAGLDTVATLTVNGAELGRTANMHRSYRFDLRPHLRPGANELSIRFDSAHRYAEALRDTLGDRPGAYPEPFNFIRKMACNFGWDWGPRLVTAGIWRPIGLHAWGTARLDQVRPLATVAGDDGRVVLHIGLERAGDAPVTVAATVAGETVRTTVPPGEHTATLQLRIPGVRRWWPRGHGSQPRYDAEVVLADAAGRPLDRWRRRIGFRSVRLDTTPDADGTPFTIVVNDRPVSVRGFNWIPDDCFPHRVDRARYATRLRQAAAAGANCLRVWGGGRYESEDFYDLADELGILVQQDFLFACAAYPEEEPIAGEVAAEAREQVVALAHHPSLVLWTGNNENIWGHADWDWAPRLDGRTWGAGYYFEVLPRIVAELDPTRPYWPGSPYSGRADLHPNDPAHGSTHIWDVWNTHDYTHYASYRPRFVAEFGFQGPPAYATLARAVRPPFEPGSAALRQRQKAEDGTGKLRRGLAGHLPEPAGFDDWHWATQLNQARAVQFGVEHLRALHPLCTGAIVWQLNDCWPVISWAAVDGDGRRKPLWYAVRRAFAERLLTVQAAPDGLDLVAVNDTGADWSGLLAVTRVTFAGDPKASVTLEFAVAPRAAVRLRLPDEVGRPDDPATELLTVSGGGATRHHFFAEDVALALPDPRYDTRITTTGTGLELTVTAGTLLRDLALFPDRLDPSSTVDDMMVTLLPGDSATFRVDTTEPLDPTALTAPPVLRCVNDLRARP
ncbi:glycosyl hydrolase 2 galactose-binding domain-containing protein [Actinophytocola sp.]|uniref:glycosyl hydrolase 2 galactose-binding domain-containing protein n=1 Tax=Actinophytocola sp. TaxID=1872138 RepID=UPI002D807BBE|nr:glycoside hydrolase family 2 protein [Actinophytocola sp.]HET9141825.1 glycoside hydrolase family 2 protein [Actinophytocola sp.]